MSIWNILGTPTPASSNLAALISWIQDGVGAITRSVSSRLRNDVYITDFGAVPNAGDCAAAIRNAIAYGIANRRKVKITDGRFRVDSSLGGAAWLVLEGNGITSILDYSQTADTDPLISAFGTLAAGTNVPSAVIKYSSTVNSTAHGLVVGDWFRIISTVDANSAAAGEDRLGARVDVVYLTETHQVETVTDANNFTIRGFFRFGYPIGSAIKKINFVEGIQLSNFVIDMGSRNVRPIQIELGKTSLLTNITIERARAEILIRGCFDGTKLLGVKAAAVANQNTGVNAQFIKVTDGSVGVVVENFDLANGGQMIDITYTPSLTASLSAPTLDTQILNGVVRNSYLSAIVDHPTCDGTVVSGCLFYNVRGAVYIRSRNGKVLNNLGWGKDRDDTSSLAVWAGEDGYWNQITVKGNSMFGFYAGYWLSGAGSTITRRDALLEGNLSKDCRYGEVWGSTNVTANSDGSLSSGSRHLSPTIAGILVSSNWLGLRILDFVVKGGVPSVGGIELSATVSRLTLKGRLADIGGQPGLVVSGGTPVFLSLDISRVGDVGANSGLTYPMVIQEEKLLATHYGPFSVTGTTLVTDLIASLATIEKGQFALPAHLRVLLKGTITGTAGVKVLRVSTSTGTEVSGAFTLPATLNNTFVVEIYVKATSGSARISFLSLEADGLAADNPSGPASRAVTIADILYTLKLTTENASAADTITVDTAEVYMAAS